MIAQLQSKAHTGPERRHCCAAYFRRWTRRSSDRKYCGRQEFVWHHHANEDELFLVVKRRLLIKLRDRDIWLDEGKFVIIPKGVEHCPVAEEEVHVLLLEPKSTGNTGNVQNERTVGNQWI
jgi:mannose-6-phosphate isomerase-like protein (cupin superfamily)